MSAAKTAVIAPTQVTTVSAVVVPPGCAPICISGYTRATRKTPAATMVAA